MDCPAGALIRTSFSPESEGVTVTPVVTMPHNEEPTEISLGEVSKARCPAGCLLQACPPDRLPPHPGQTLPLDQGPMRLVWPLSLWAASTVSQPAATPVPGGDRAGLEQRRVHCEKTRAGLEHGVCVCVRGCIRGPGHGEDKYTQVGFCCDAGQ